MSKLRFHEVHRWTHDGTTFALIAADKPGFLVGEARLCEVVEDSVGNRFLSELGPEETRHDKAMWSLAKDLRSRLALPAKEAP